MRGFALPHWDCGIFLDFYARALGECAVVLGERVFYTHVRLEFFIWQCRLKTDGASCCAHLAGGSENETSERGRFKVCKARRVRPYRPAFSDRFSPPSESHFIPLLLRASQCGCKRRPRRFALLREGTSRLALLFINKGRRIRSGLRLNLCGRVGRRCDSVTSRCVLCVKMSQKFFRAYSAGVGRNAGLSAGDGFRRGFNRIFRELACEMLYKKAL